jgi:hypothetical protein
MFKTGFGHPKSRDILKCGRYTYHIIHFNASQSCEDLKQGMPHDSTERRGREIPGRSGEVGKRGPGDSARKGRRGLGVARGQVKATPAQL